MDPIRNLWKNRALCLLITTALLVANALVSPVRADPADWGESDWYKFIEMSVSVGLDKLHGGIEQVPRWMNQKPVNGRLPLLDAYAALSAAGSTVKPGLTFWLHGKMREARDAGDWDRLDGYQAYDTALQTGNQGPLRRFLKERARRAREKSKDKGGETRPLTPPSLVLDNLLASVGSSKSVEVVPQFTVGGNEDGSLSKVRARAMIRGPKTSFIESVEVSLAQPTGYQAAQFFLQLPPGSPSGRYTVGVTLSDSRGLSTELKKATFDYAAPTRAEEPPEIEEPPTTEEPVRTEDPPPTEDPPRSEDPPPTVEPEKGPGKSPSDSPKLRVVLSAPASTPVGRVVNLSCRVQGGSPPYTYSWQTDGKRWSSQAVNLDYDTPGTKSVVLVVTDTAGSQGRTSTVVRVTDGIAVNISGPRQVKVGETASYSPLVVTGPSSGFLFSWTVDGQTGVGESFTPIFRTPGRKTLICTAKHPEHPPYQSKAFVTVKEPTGERAEGPLSVSIVGPTRLEVGEMATFSPRVKGGVPPYRYLWSSKGKSLSEKQIRGSFDEPGERTIVLKVTDSSGADSATATVRVKVTESEKMVVKIVGPTRAKVGERITFSPDVRGGTGPYRYVWTVEGLTAEKKTIQGAFDDEGQETVKLAVYDSKRASTVPVTASTVVTISPKKSDTKNPSTVSRPNRQSEPRRPTTPSTTTQAAPLKLEDLAGGTYLITFRGKPSYYYRFTSERHKMAGNYIVYRRGVKDSKWKPTNYRMGPSGPIISGLAGYTQGNAQSFTWRFVPYAGNKPQTYRFVRQ